MSTVPKCGSWYPALAGEFTHDKDFDGDISAIREKIWDMGMLKRTAASAGDKLLKLKIEHKEEGGRQHIVLQYLAAGKELIKVEGDVPAKDLKIKNQQGDDVTVEWVWESADQAKWAHGYNLHLTEKAAKYTTNSHFGYGADGKFKVHIIAEGSGKKLEVTRVFK